jgi:hypothetical protein
MSHRDIKHVSLRNLLLLNDVVCRIGVPTSIVTITIQSSYVGAISIEEIERYLNLTTLTIGNTTNIAMAATMVKILFISI